MSYPEWVPFAVAILAAILTFVNGLIFFSVRSLVGRLEKIERENDHLWREISAMKVDSAKEGATRADIQRLQEHLQKQDAQLSTLNSQLATLLARANLASGFGA